MKECTMDFNLTEDQVAIRDMARKFAAERVAPFADEWDERAFLPRDLIREMGELGFFGCLIPEEYGGTDTGFLAMCLLVEEVGKVSGSVRGAFNMQCSGTAYNICKNGSPQQKEKYVGDLISGERLGCFAITEPDAGSDVFAMKLQAKKDGDSYVLNGTKTWISYATVADVAIVYGYTDPAAGTKGMSAFIVDMDQPGISTSILHKFGSNAFPTGEIVFDNARIPGEAILRKPGDGARILFNSLTDTRIICAAGAVGLAQACLEACIQYCNQRVQFGKPIGQFQMNQAIIADMAVEIEAARLLVYRAAVQKDQGNAGNVLECSYAKYFAANTAAKAANLAMEIHGAYGYSTEYPIGRYLRDAKLYQIVEGTSNIHRMIIGMDQMGIRKANR
jgi:glutaryl-CoA dehydrogenase (non-decarboxylating)